MINNEEGAQLILATLESIYGDDRQAGAGIGLYSQTLYSALVLCLFNAFIVTQILEYRNNGGEAAVYTGRDEKKASKEVPVEPNSEEENTLEAPVGLDSKEESSEENKEDPDELDSRPCHWSVRRIIRTTRLHHWQPGLCQ